MLYPGGEGCLEKLKVALRDHSAQLRPRLHLLQRLIVAEVSVGLATDTTASSAQC